MLNARQPADLVTTIGGLRALLSALCLLWLFSPLAHADDAALAELTPEEKAWVAAHPKIVFGVDADWQPQFIRQADGSPSGIDGDTITRLNQLLGTNIVIEQGKWGELVERLKRREIDGLTSSSVQADRLGFASFTVPYAEYGKFLYVRRDNPPEIAWLSDLAGKRIAYQAGNLFDQKWLQNHPGGIVPLAKATLPELVEAVISGEADGFVGSLSVEYRLIRLGITQVVPAMPLDATIDVVLAVRSDWPELLVILNKGLAAIPPAEREAILARWIKTPSATSMPWMKMMMWAGAVLLLATLLILLVLVWNRNLMRQVSLKTQELTGTLEDLRVVERKLLAILDAIPGVFILYDQNARPVLWNRNVETVLGMSKEQFSQSDGIFVVPEDKAKVQDAIRQTLQGNPCSVEATVQTPDGRCIPYIFNSAPFVQNQKTGFMAFGLDLSKQKHDESEINRLTNYDPLTGLPNRSLLMEHLMQTIALAHRQQRLAAILLIDIDRFKNLNDARGHELGDRFLLAFGGRIAGQLREEDTLAHTSADEFCILLRDLGEQREVAGQHAMRVVKKIQEDLRLPFEFAPGDEIIVTVSIGLTLFPVVQGEDVTNEVMRRADTALNRAKDAGGNQVAFFDTTMGQQVEHRYQIESDLHRAVPAGELRLYLQPQVDHTGQVVGAEVLVRWQHPQRGLLAPGIFIPIAEESDLIVSLSEWVMMEACRLVADAVARGLILNLSINVSPRHFRQAKFVPWLKTLISETGADPLRLTLEITEGLVIEDVGEVIAKMSELVVLGFHFSIDDFGTGYSSLAYLKRLPIHELKIDKTFVQDAPNDPDDAALVETILSIADHMRLKVVAEGVETDAQASFLNSRGTVIHQGYLYGKPEHAQMWIERWLSEVDGGRDER